MQVISSGNKKCLTHSRKKWVPAPPLHYGGRGHIEWRGAKALAGGQVSAPRAGGNPQDTGSSDSASRVEFISRYLYLRGLPGISCCYHGPTFIVSCSL